MPTIIEKVLWLQDLDIFSYVSTEDLAQLASVADHSSIDAGRILFQREEPCSEVHLLVGGRVSLESDRSKTLVEKTGLDLWSFFSKNPHLFTARTVEPCSLLVVSVDDFDNVLAAAPEFSSALLRYFASLGRALQDGASG